MHLKSNVPRVAFLQKISRAHKQFTARRAGCASARRLEAWGHADDGAARTHWTRNYTMTEMMLVRTAHGGWEELQPQTTLPDGGIVELFGEDIGPVLGAPSCVVVAAARPALAVGSPDALCVDASGGVWIVQLALDGGGEHTLPQLLAFGGALTGMSWSTFEQLCDRRGADTLDAYVAARAPSSFDRDAFQQSVSSSLAHGRLRLVSIVREAAPTLVQSMRFLNASGALGYVFEASSFASASVTAVRAKAVDVGGAHSVGAAEADAPADGAARPTAAPAAVESPPASQTPSAPAAAAPRAKAAAAPVPPPSMDPVDAFVAAVAEHEDAATADLMRQLVDGCSVFDEVRIDGEGSDQELHVAVATGDALRSLVVAMVDGSVVVSFEALGSLDADWSIRAELCQGMERLLGTDLGDVRKISQLNLVIAEHLMDATLMEALVELLVETAVHLQGSDRAKAAA